MVKVRRKKTLPCVSFSFQYTLKTIAVNSGKTIKCRQEEKKKKDKQPPPQLITQKKY